MTVRTMDAIEALRTRRSYGRLTEPAPADDDLRTMLEAAAAAPDHGELRPFRFAILRGGGMDAFGGVLEQAYLRRCRDAGTEPVPAKAQKERTKLGRAPLVIVVSAVRQAPSKIPWVDQRDAAVAATAHVLLATHALGYGAMWRTGAPCDDSHVRKALGLIDEDAVVGFVYVGTPHETKPPKDVDLAPLVTEFAG
jgi:nitroreductase